MYIIRMISNSNSVKAFSVLEAAVSMVITAIVIGLVFMIFSILSERMLDFKNQNQFVADMNRFTYVINKDIFDNENMATDETGITFKGYSGDITKYLSDQNYTIRQKNEFVDTFNIPITNLRLDTLTNKNKKIVFLRLRMNLDVNEQLMDLKFFKMVYSNQLMENYK